MSRRNAALLSTVLFVLIGSGLARAQSEATARGEPVWEADAPMAAATTCFPSSAPEMQRQFNPNGGWDGPPEPKGRFLAVTAGDPGQLQTIRVTWDAMPNWSGGHIALIGQQRWITEPFQVCENSGVVAGPPCPPSPGQPQRWFWAARLTCDPLQAWFGDLAGLANYCARTGEPCTVDGDCAAGTCGVDGVIHVVNRGIVPSKRNPAQSATYTVQVIDEGCGLLDEANYSDSLVVTNPVYGDVLLSNGTCPTGLPNNNPDISDVVGVINKFSNSPCAPKKTRADLQPVDLNFKISVVDCLQSLAGFSGRPYPFPDGVPCPTSREP